MRKTHNRGWAEDLVGQPLPRAGAVGEGATRHALTVARYDKGERLPSSSSEATDSQQQA